MGRSPVIDQARSSKYQIQSTHPLLYVSASLTGLCLVLIVVRNFVLGDEPYPPLLINLSIAWCPVLLSALLMNSLRFLSTRWLRLAFVATLPIWLLFLPNAPYLVTDYVHIFANSDYSNYPLDNLMLWYDLVLFFVYSFCGLLLWYASVSHLHTIATMRLNPRIGWVGVVGLSYITSLGIYFGRRLRLNSWDVVIYPGYWSKAVAMMSTFDWVAFTVFFGSFLVVMYMVFHFLRYRKTSFGAQTFDERRTF